MDYIKGMSYTALINEIPYKCIILKDPLRLALCSAEGILIGSFRRREIYQNWVKDGFLKNEGVKMSVKNEKGIIIKDFSVE